MNVNVSGQWIRLKSAVDVRLRPKVLSSIPFRGAFALAAGGYFLTRYLSMLDKVSSHFPRSPFTHPSSPTLARILSLFLCFFFFAVFVFPLVLFASFPRSSALPRPTNFVAMFFVASYKKPLPAPTVRTNSTFSPIPLLWPA